MDVSNIGGTYAAEGWMSQGSPELSSEKNDDALGRSQFLNLLVAQLQNQDPLNPLDGTDFTAQLAQFSSLEQMFNMNDALSDIHQLLEGAESENVLDYIGKTVRSGDNNTLFLDSGETTGGTYTLDDRAEVLVRIYDSEGAEICTMDSGWKDQGEHTVAWNGMNGNGDIVSNGEYRYTVEARDQEGNPVFAETSFVGEVTGVTYRNGTTFLMIEERLIPADNIIEVRQTTGSQG